MRGHGMVQPWAQPIDQNPVSTPLTLRTTFEIRRLPQAVCHLLLEQPDRWQIKINGVNVPLDAASEWFIDPCFRKFPLPDGCLKVGRNTLELFTVFQEGVDLEALYLLGNFGVYANRSGATHLDLPPQKLLVGDICSQGFPHYTGRIEYQLDLPPTKRAQRRVRLRSVGGALATVRFPDQSQATSLPFQPRFTILPGSIRTLFCEVILTRRNLFGPLHLVPKIQNAITPASFRSTGTACSRTPQLFPSGLLKAPEID